MVSLYSRFDLALTSSENRRYSGLSGLRSVTVRTASNALRATSLRSSESLARNHGLISFDLLHRTQTQRYTQLYTQRYYYPFAKRGQHNVTVWRPSVCPSVCTHVYMA